MTCSNCQRALKDDAIFCNHCGQVVPRELEVEAEDAAPVEVETIESAEDLTSDEPVDVDDLEVEEQEEEDEGDEDEDEDEVPAPSTSNSQAKSFRTVWLLAVFGGWLGIDRFYLGHIGTGVLKLLGAGWYGIWWSVDMIRLLRGRQADKSGVLVEDRDNFRPVAVVISTVLFTLIGLCWLIVILAAMTPNSSD